MITGHNKYSKKEISAFLAGMEYAAKTACVHGEGYIQALEIRKEALEMKRLSEGGK